MSSQKTPGNKRDGKNLELPDLSNQQLKQIGKAQRLDIPEMLRGGEFSKVGKIFVDEKDYEAAMVMFAKNREKLMLEKTSTEVYDATVRSVFENHGVPERNQQYLELSEKPPELSRKYWAVVRRKEINYM